MEISDMDGATTLLGFDWTDSCLSSLSRLTTRETKAQREGGLWQVRRVVCKVVQVLETDHDGLTVLRAR
ncbi:hypothetical protein Pmani_025008 [Petrolisthes manimaculis]|uniref:Uncharacterized protein n=1 Tax=Petrolisthes manimaculis TaxID=1843537 RepID=A0AAE1P6G6_9EUCA|nr:hypothetical protein Pmani_025008 [Petrolisthes manimaculis]